MSRRKRQGRRERAHMKYMAKCHDHERKVAKRVRHERTMSHRANLINNVIKIEESETESKTRRLGFLRRLLGR